MTRAISTVVDVAICLVLVTAAVATLTTAESRTAPGADAADVAAVLASTTATVEYVDHADHPITATGTVAGLLADAATVNEPSNRSFVHAVRTETRHALERFARPVEVVAVPPGGPPGIEVGETPPPGIDVHSRMLVVPTGTTEHREKTAVTIVVRTWSP